MAGNVDTNGGNLNIPATEEIELAATMAEPETISLEREFEVPEATVEMSTESPKDGGADVEGAGNKVYTQ